MIEKSDIEEHLSCVLYHVKSLQSILKDGCHFKDWLIPAENLEFEATTLKQLIHDHRMEQA